MSKEPIISFVIPVYKKPADVFERCLRSLYDQSMKQIEVITVFDGPDQDLQKIAERYRTQLVVIDHAGAPRARNVGLDVANGKYVWFWDADCIIKPDHAKRMVEEFEATDADFVYSGFDMGEGEGGMDSEPFNRYSLECGNYISSMAPIKREKAHKWDESLEAAQDWDYWLTATEKGLKGVFVEGRGFVTETYKTGLSSNKWSMANRDQTIRTVRHKHGIPDREIGVYSMNYREMSIKLAQILNADIIKPTGYTPTCYKTILNFGYSYMSRFDGIASDVTKIQYWLPGEIELLKTRSYEVVMQTVKVAKGVINWVNTQYEQNKLSEYGIESEVVHLPLAKEDYEKVSHELPKDFTVLVSTDQAYADLLKDLSTDLPHINFKYNAAKVEDFSCYVSFYQFAALDNAMLIAHINGRPVISNVQAPFCGFIDPDQTWEKFKAELYRQIAILRNSKINKEAQDYYLELSKPEKFIEKVNSYNKIALEVA